MEQRAAGQSHVAQAQLTQSSTAQSQAVLGGRQEQAHAEHGQDLDALALPPLVPVQRGAREGAPGAGLRVLRGDGAVLHHSGRPAAWPVLGCSALVGMVPERVERASRPAGRPSVRPRFRAR
ncbi:hypothetical protein [Actinosynnema mirum]|uniref:Uncharacterized protein n=1 Tax=Actinosynnema mirum (strain ATCC 29888 / DSM 43827 / JCM 3225 / NBRC 14064 / NCIMB 13271 / NRRL B-12336 / IMRU 3971 / 101) TaxID=446462 RepID=C6WLS7_ACTMD|nr:hypothetical protein [Actinosynnema mirum]ACU40312.1 hypothetical protein Amir_6512 [Actinosynnema mirum DSM 43827]